MKKIKVRVKKEELINVVNLISECQKINSDESDIIKVRWYNKGVFIYSINGDVRTNKVNFIKSISIQKNDFIYNFPADLNITWLINSGKDWVNQHKLILKDGSDEYVLIFNYDEESYDTNNVETISDMFSLRCITADQRNITDLTPEISEEKFNTALADWSVVVTTEKLEYIKKMSKFNSNKYLELGQCDGFLKISDVSWDMSLREEPNNIETVKFVKSDINHISTSSDYITIYAFQNFLLIDENSSYYMFVLRMSDDDID